MSATPILDRERVLPVPVSPRSELRVVYVVWSIVLTAFAISVLIGRPSWLRRWLLIDLRRLIDQQGLVRAPLLAIGTVIVVSFIMVAVHEVGHVAGGLAAGFRFRSIRVGPLQLDSPFRLSFGRGGGNPFAGVTMMIPVTTDRLVPRGKLLVLGGPGANILSGCCVLLLPAPMSLPSLLFVVQSIGNGLSDLLPYRCAHGVSDGAFLWALFRHPARAERWLAGMRLNRDVRDGISARSPLSARARDRSASPGRSGSV